MTGGASPLFRKTKMVVEVKVKRQQSNRSVKQVFMAYILHVTQVDGFISVGREGVYAYKINVSAKKNQMLLICGYFVFKSMMIIFNCIFSSSIKVSIL